MSQPLAGRHPDPPSERRRRALVITGLAAGVTAPILSWAWSVAVIINWPGYDPIRQSISILVDAPLGWLQSAAFLVAGVLGIGWAFALPFALGTTARDRAIVRGTLLLQAAITIGFAVLPTDPIGVPTTLVGTLHLLDFFLYAVTMPLTLLAMGLVMRRDPRWSRTATRWTLSAAGLAIVSIALVPVTLYGPLERWLGLLERLFVAIPSIWQVGAGIVAMRLARTTAPPT